MNERHCLAHRESHRHSSWNTSSETGEAQESPMGKITSALGREESITSSYENQVAIQSENIGGPSQINGRWIV